MIFSMCYSKKYLSQKNVVEKMNANVMQGKVRHVALVLLAEINLKLEMHQLSCSWCIVRI